MKYQCLSDNDLKEVCAGLEITLVRADLTMSVPDAAVPGATNALMHVTGYPSFEVNHGDHGIANISSDLDGYVAFVGLPVAGSKSGQF